MTQHIAKGLIMLAELTVKPEALNAFTAYTAENLPVCRAYPGNLRFDILVDRTAPEKVAFYEVWETPEAQQSYMAWRVQNGDLDRLLSMLACEPQFTALREVRA